MTSIPLVSLEPDKPKKHPKCKGETSFDYEYGYDHECGYPTGLTCDECKYGAGRKDPEAACNHIDVY